MRPDVHDFVVTFARRDDALAILFLDFLDLLLRGVNFLVAFLGHNHVVNADGRAGLRGLAETKFLELVEHRDGFVVAGKLVTLPDQIAELALAGGLVVKAEFRRPNLAEDDAADGRFDDFLGRVAENGLPAEIRIRQANPIVRLQRAIVIGENHFFLRAEQRQFPRVGGHRRARFGGEIITAERDVLRRRDDRPAGRRAENVVRRHHQQARFHLRLDGQRHVHGHLVAVEIRVVSGANQRMNANRFAFDQLRLERLHGQTVQRRRAIEQHRMALGHFFQNVPDFLRLALDHFLRAANGVDVAEFLQAGG